MSRATLWISAGACLSVAIVLTLLGVGDQAGALPNWQALVAGPRPGGDRAAADLLVGPSDPRAVAGRLAVPEGARRLQPDVRRGAAPGHARRRRRLFLARHRACSSPRGSGRSGRRRIETGEERIAWFVFVATIPAAAIGLLGEDAIASNLGEPWQIAIAAGRLRARPLVRRPAAAAAVDGGSRPEGSGGRWGLRRAWR